MSSVIGKVLSLLSPREKRQAYFLLGMILVMALLDVIGIASIMPFMAVLANPDVVDTNSWLNAVYTRLEFSEPQRFLRFLGIVVFVALVISVVFKAATTWAITYFTQMRNYSIARRLVAGYLAQPYEWFLNRHSAELGKAVLSEVQQVVGNALVPLMRLLAQGAVVIAILVLLVAVDPLLALIVGGAMGGAYAVIYLSLRNMLKRIGEDRVEADRQ
ncbi:MAG: ABC transporter ATP-binding protein, partial [Gammaproteobacteria bacterium]|nr:ABC transporter ATP-binding protein [Gammaproteobacteria bacterium]